MCNLSFGVSITEMGSCWVGNFTLLLLITVYFTSLPSETTAAGTQVKKIYDSMKQKTPELGSSVRELFDSAVKKAPELSSSVKDVYKSSYDYGSSTVNRVGAAVSDVRKWYLQDGPATRDIGLGIYNSVKQNLLDLNKDIYNSVNEKMPELSSIKDEKAGSDLTSFAETLVLIIIQELAKTVPGGVPAYNIISKSLHGDKNFKDVQDQSELAKFVTEIAKTAGLYAIERGVRSVPGGGSAYKLLSQSLRDLRKDKGIEDYTREIKELRARIDRLEKGGCGCDKLRDQTEISEMDLGKSRH